VLASFFFWSVIVTRKVSVLYIAMYGQTVTS
jgi:hypothetical protein